MKGMTDMQDTCTYNSCKILARTAARFIARFFTCKIPIDVLARIIILQESCKDICKILQESGHFMFKMQVSYK